MLQCGVGSCSHHSPGQLRAQHCMCRQSAGCLQAACTLCTRLAGLHMAQTAHRPGQPGIRSIFCSAKLAGWPALGWARQQGGGRDREGGGPEGGGGGTETSLVLSCCKEGDSYDGPHLPHCPALGRERAQHSTGRGLQLTLRVSATMRAGSEAPTEL